jgi:hypothetical protein
MYKRVISWNLDLVADVGKNRARSALGSLTISEEQEHLEH